MLWFYVTVFDIYMKIEDAFDLYEKLKDIKVKPYIKPVSQQQLEEDSEAKDTTTSTENKTIEVNLTELAQETVSLFIFICDIYNITVIWIF